MLYRNRCYSIEATYVQEIFWKSLIIMDDHWWSLKNDQDIVINEVKSIVFLGILRSLLKHISFYKNNFYKNRRMAPKLKWNTPFFN